MTGPGKRNGDGFPEIGISPEKVRFIAIKARQFDAKEGASDGDDASNAVDDRMAEVLEDRPKDDMVRQELMQFIDGLDDDEQISLVALAWVGRGTYDVSEWPDALKRARDAHNDRTAEYLLGVPLLGDYLANGLEALGRNFDDETDAEFRESQSPIDRPT